MSERQGSGAAAGNNKTSEAQDFEASFSTPNESRRSETQSQPTQEKFIDRKDASKTNVPEDFDIDMDDPETAKAAVAIQSQFRKFQKKKTEKS